MEKFRKIARINSWKCHRLDRMLSRKMRREGIEPSFYPCDLTNWKVDTEKPIFHTFSKAFALEHFSTSYVLFFLYIHTYVYLFFHKNQVCSLTGILKSIRLILWRSILFLVALQKIADSYIFASLILERFSEKKKKENFIFSRKLRKAMNINYFLNINYRRESNKIIVKFRT